MTFWVPLKAHSDWPFRSFCCCKRPSNRVKITLPPGQSKLLQGSSSSNIGAMLIWRMGSPSPWRRVIRVEGRECFGMDQERKEVNPNSTNILLSESYLALPTLSPFRSSNLCQLYRWLIWCKKHFFQDFVFRFLSHSLTHTHPTFLAWLRATVLGDRTGLVIVQLNLFPSTSQASYLCFLMFCRSQVKKSFAARGSPSVPWLLVPNAGGSASLLDGLRLLLGGGNAQGGITLGCL